MMATNPEHLREAREILTRNASFLVDEWMSASSIAGHADLVFLVVVHPNVPGAYDYMQSWDRNDPATPFHVARALGVPPEDPRILVLLDPLPQGQAWVCLRSGPIAETFGVDIAKLELQRVQRQMVAARRIVH